MKDLTEYQKVELAKAYVALSNAHKLQFVLPMFAPEASYQSANVGLFHGRKAIGEMMNSFFSQYPDVYWEVKDYRYMSNGSVRFDFVMLATETQTGDKIKRMGTEEIEFTDEGLINRLVVYKR